MSRSLLPLNAHVRDSPFRTCTLNRKTNGQKRTRMFEIRHVYRRGQALESPMIHRGRFLASIHQEWMNEWMNVSTNSKLGQNVDPHSDQWWGECSAHHHWHVSLENVTSDSSMFLSRHVMVSPALMLLDKLVGRNLPFRHRDRESTPCSMFLVSSPLSFVDTSLFTERNNRQRLRNRRRNQFPRKCSRRASNTSNW